VIVVSATIELRAQATAAAALSQRSLEQLLDALAERLDAAGTRPVSYLAGLDTHQAAKILQAGMPALLHRRRIHPSHDEHLVLDRSTGHGIRVDMRFDRLSGQVRCSLAETDHGALYSQLAAYLTRWDTGDLRQLVTDNDPPNRHPDRVVDARRLADALSTDSRVAVTATYDLALDVHVVRWSGGPSIDYMRSLAYGHACDLAALYIDELRWERQ
jgi:hypothetical protein